MSTTWESLPNDCWETVFGFLDDHEPLSLVNKRFLTITSLARLTLTIPSTCSEFYPTILHTRFPNLTHLNLSRTHHDLDAFVRQLANSGLRLRSLRVHCQTRLPGNAMRLLGRSSVSSTLKSLSCTGFDCLDDDDLFVIADCFSYLHRLELKHSIVGPGDHTITDRGILLISIKLKSLTSFTVRCGENVTYRSFHYLSSNCPLLSDLKAQIIRISLVGLESFCSFASLSSLNLNHVNISDHGLLQLSQANLRVWKLALRNPHPSAINGAALCRLLASCRSLRHLVLKFAAVTKDATPLDFVASIPNVNYLHITNVRLITPTILFDLLERCPNLEDVALKINYAEIVKYSSHNLPVHMRLRKLFLTGWGFNDEFFMLVASICPKLESLVVNLKSDITDAGMKAIRASCCNIKFFYLWGRRHIPMNN